MISLRSALSSLGLRASDLPGFVLPAEVEERGHSFEVVKSNGSGAK